LSFATGLELNSFAILITVSVLASVSCILCSIRRERREMRERKTDEVNIPYTVSCSSDSPTFSYADPDSPCNGCGIANCGYCPCNFGLR
jgi:hypothetical protein